MATDWSCSASAAAGWRLTLFDQRGEFYESPALIGCALAISRALYEELLGFDTGMKEWGVEDLDFGLKAWLMGSMVLNDPKALIGHRFRRAFDNYTVGAVHPLANQLRMARKHFTESVWLDSVPAPTLLPGVARGVERRVTRARAGGRQPRTGARVSANRRMRDEYWYAGPSTCVGRAARPNLQLRLHVHSIWTTVHVQVYATSLALIGRGGKGGGTGHVLAAGSTAHPLNLSL